MDTLIHFDVIICCVSPITSFTYRSHIMLWSTILEKISFSFHTQHISILKSGHPQQPSRMLACFARFGNANIKLGEEKGEKSGKRERRRRRRQGRGRRPLIVIVKWTRARNVGALCICNGTEWEGRKESSQIATLHLCHFCASPGA